MPEAAGPLWYALREAAGSFCPPLEIVEERPRSLALVLRDPQGGGELRLRYRSERGLFLRTFYLVAEAEVPGLGPAQAGRLVLRRRTLAWKRPKPRDGRRWSRQLASEEVRAALRRVPHERLALGWDPVRESWALSLETLAGSVTSTFFPPLLTPNPLKAEEAAAVVDLVAALRRASRTPA